MLILCTASLCRNLTRLSACLAFLGLAPSLAAESPPQTTRSAPIAFDGVCGDWTCNPSEDCNSCPDDCGFCFDACGDGICQSSESCSSCSYDCGPCSENRSVVVAAKRYWADYASNAIWRSNLDGSQVEPVYSVNGPFGISYDPSAGHLIWTSATDETVQASPIGGGIITLPSSFEENFAIAFKATGQTAQAVVSDTSATARVAVQSTTSLSYSVIGTEVVRLTEDINTGNQQREVLLTLSSADEVRGLTLSADGTALYLGDSVGRMSRKINIASHAVEWLLFDEYSQLPFSAVRSKEAHP